MKNYLWLVLKALKFEFVPSLYTACLQLHALEMSPALSSLILCEECSQKDDFLKYI